MLIFFFFLLCILSYAPLHLTYTPIPFRHRRILHQPFFPLENSVPPSPSPQPKVPFSANAPPFFPYDTSSPPPPPASALATFPANISSLAIPRSPTKKPSSPRIAIFILISLLFFALFVVFALFLYRRRRNYVKKSPRSDSHRLFHANGAASDGHKIHVSGTSSEFLYLGTLVNSHRVDGDGDPGNDARNSPYRKLGSPELHPLPPLARQFRQNYGNATGLGSEDEGDEEFYSPRGSSGGKDSPAATRSSSRRVFPVVATEKQDDCSLNSKSQSYPSSSSASPAPSSPHPSNSPSTGPSSSPSPQHSTKTSSLPIRISPERPIIRSPTSPHNGISGDVGFLHLPPPPPPPPPPPRPMAPSPPKRKPPLPSPPSSPLENDLDKIAVSSDRIPNISTQIRQSPMRICDFPKHPFFNPLPPPPPPPPPAGFWDTPIPPPPNRRPNSRPPILVTPSRTIEAKNPAVVSPEALPENSDSVEKNEETPRPKLKALHWDKVRASSDRAMVWDQLKSSSFQYGLLHFGL